MRHILSNFCCNQRDVCVGTGAAGGGGGGGKASNWKMGVVVSAFRFPKLP